MDILNIFIIVIFALCISSNSSTINRLKQKLKKLTAKKEGGNDMSKILNELIGKKCIIKTSENFSESLYGIIVDVDEDWVKIEQHKKSGAIKSKIVRVDLINSIDKLD